MGERPYIPRHHTPYIPRPYTPYIPRPHTPYIPRPHTPYIWPDEPYIRRPQDEFIGFKINNDREQPFHHSGLEIGERQDGRIGYVHPLETFSELAFLDKDVGCIEPKKPLPIEETPFKLVKDVKELLQLADKLKLVDEFAVDLEHNGYRTFQGLTCLMQISTRREDYIVDTLELRLHVGPQLREVFKDPCKKKVMHGADNDILWLQRDFGIYICNLFDTQLASKVLNRERNGLEFVLLDYCGVTVNKGYQKSDWSLRPLPDAMIKYAREDTHYLLYIHDRMRRELQSASTGANDANNLLQVNKYSYDLCKQLYEKKLFTFTSYLNIRGLDQMYFNSQQLSVLAGLYEWRDSVARERDESTGYILPNKTVLEIASQVPLTVLALQQCLLGSNHHVVSDLDSIVFRIKRSIQNASAFEFTAQFVKRRNQIRARTSDGTSNGMNGKTATWQEGAGIVECSRTLHVPSFQPSDEVRETRTIQDGNKLDPRNESFPISEQRRGIFTDNGNPDLTKAIPGTTEKVVDPPAIILDPGVQPRIRN